MLCFSVECKPFLHDIVLDAYGPIIVQLYINDCFAQVFVFYLTLFSLNLLLVFYLNKFPLQMDPLPGETPLLDLYNIELFAYV